MTTNGKETLSSMFDDEASELEIRRLFRESEGDELVKEWDALQMTQDAIAGRPVLDGRSMLDRIHNELDGVTEAPAAYSGAERNLNEDTASVSSTQTDRRWRSLAIAASVALGVVLGANFIGPLEQEADSRSGEIAGSVEVLRDEYRVTSQRFEPAAETGEVLVPESPQLFREYLLRHAESASISERGSVVQFARLVGFSEDD